MLTLAELERAAESGPTSALPRSGDDIIEAIRVDAGVSPTAIAAAVGCSERTWHRFEKSAGHRFATRALDLRAARVLAFLAKRSEGQGR